jgi:CRISPR/Cas system-associated exonuclease Cas4 (RecB family)
MTIPPDFQFSQSSLQDYVDCPRRFEIRHLRKIKWPALQTEPALEYEENQKMGQLFHRLVHQYELGIPVDQIMTSEASPTIIRWWRNFVASIPKRPLPENRYPEYRMSSSLAGFRIVGQFDLLAINPGSEVMIIDWKTSRSRISTRRLHTLMQTHLYPLLMIEAGKMLNKGEKIIPEQVEMIYWFTEFPDAAEHIHYSMEKYISDLDLIENLISEINNQPETPFPLTGEEKNCHFCNYRSLCDRGIKAGDWTAELCEMLDPPQILPYMDFDQLSEVEF